MMGHVLEGGGDGFGKEELGHILEVYFVAPTDGSDEKVEEKREKDAAEQQDGW